MTSPVPMDVSERRHDASEPGMGIVIDNDTFNAYKFGQTLKETGKKIGVVGAFALLGFGMYRLGAVKESRHDAEVAAQIKNADHYEITLRPAETLSDLYAAEKIAHGSVARDAYMDDAITDGRNVTVSDADGDGLVGHRKGRLVSQ